ncbi:MAG TPA: TatD family hydrolase [Candidatus Nanoarchaeia archaeon]|nr:TatD family hydrolase [Candidatus Nanoarchaeia archaeon]
MPNYIDIHSHLNFENFDSDRDAVIAKLKEDRIWTITVGTDVKDSKSAIALAEKHDHLFATVGIHPTHEWTDADIPELDVLASHKRVVAIGECGLDFFRSGADEESKRKQGILFAKQIEIALKHDKPLMIHCRNAYEECLQVLSAYKTDHKLGERLRGNIHFFAGNWEVAQKFFALGFTISFDGPITFARDYDEVIKQAPLEMLMAETDAPFAAPVPYRGKRNEPGYVKEIVAKLAEIKGLEAGIVQKAMVDNAIKAFKLA